MWFKSGRNLHQIVGHAAKIEMFCHGLDRVAFLESIVVQDAVAMNLIAIGQRMIDLRDDDPSTFGEIMAGHQVIGLRHRLAHDYEAIDFDLVWTFVADHLPRLRQHATQLRDRFVDEYKVHLD